MQTTSTPSKRTPAPLGLRLPRTALPATAWLRWEVVTRAKGFHVSREAANGSRTEALLNDVGRTRVFRSAAAAALACAQANFEADAAALKREPLMGAEVRA